ADFSDSDHEWLESTARKILRIADKFPPKQTPLVAVHCDAVLTAIGAGRFPMKPDELPGMSDFDGVVTGLPDGKAASQPGFASTEASRGANESAHPPASAPIPFNPPAT